MKAEEFKKARQRLGLSVSEMAAALRINSPRSIRQYESGEREISGPVSLLVEKMLDEL